jgi:hypothetical protein
MLESLSDAAVQCLMIILTVLPIWHSYRYLTVVLSSHCLNRYKAMQLHCRPVELSLIYLGDWHSVAFCNSLDGRWPLNLQTALVTWYARASE